MKRLMFAAVLGGTLAITACSDDSEKKKGLDRELLSGNWLETANGYDKDSLVQLSEDDERTVYKFTKERFASVTVGSDEPQDTSCDSGSYSSKGKNLNLKFDEGEGSYCDRLWKLVNVKLVVPTLTEDRLEIAFHASNKKTGKSATAFYRFKRISNGSLSSELKASGLHGGDFDPLFEGLGTDTSTGIGTTDFDERENTKMHDAIEGLRPELELDGSLDADQLAIELEGKKVQTARVITAFHEERDYLGTSTFAFQNGAPIADDMIDTGDDLTHCELTLKSKAEGASIPSGVLVDIVSISSFGPSVIASEAGITIQLSTDTELRTIQCTRVLESDDDDTNDVITLENIKSALGDYIRFVD